MEDVIDYLFQTVHRFHLCKPCFQRHGDLANVEFFMLLGISVMSEGKEMGVTLSEMIEVTGMTMSAASKKVSILEEKGLVTRRASDVDKRRICITLTDKGIALCESERREKQMWMGEVITRMGTADAKQMLDFMNKMFDIMEDMEKEKTV